MCAEIFCSCKKSSSCTCEFRVALRSLKYRFYTWTIVAANENRISNRIYSWQLKPLNLKWLALPCSQKAHLFQLRSVGCKAHMCYVKVSLLFLTTAFLRFRVKSMALVIFPHVRCTSLTKFLRKLGECFSLTFYRHSLLWLSLCSTHPTSKITYDNLVLSVSTFQTLDKQDIEEEP